MWRGYKTTLKHKTLVTSEEQNPNHYYDLHIGPLWPLLPVLHSPTSVDLWNRSCSVSYQEDFLDYPIPTLSQSVTSTHFIFPQNTYGPWFFYFEIYIYFMLLILKCKPRKQKMWFFPPVHQTTHKVGVQ